MISKLEVDWRQVTECRVTAFSVVEDFDDFEDLAAGLRPRAPLPEVRHAKGRNAPRFHRLAQRKESDRGVDRWSGNGSFSLGQSAVASDSGPGRLVRPRIHPAHSCDGNP
jgi:hypothetical protein